jgi:hypothetical protein
VTKKELRLEKAKVFTGFPSLLDVTRCSVLQSQTKRPLSFASPREIKYRMFGENMTLSIPYL